METNKDEAIIRLSTDNYFISVEKDGSIYIMAIEGKIRSKKMSDDSLRIHNIKKLK